VTEEVKNEEVKVHETSASMDKSAFSELDVGSDMALKVKISCPSHCNLQGGQVRIADDAGAILKELELTSFEGAANETDEFVLKAPTKPGEYTWMAVFAAREKEGILHEESSAPFSFIAKPHATSMAVWDVPSPVMYNAGFNLKVGVGCSAACKLTGQEVEIYDHQGAKVAMGTLGDLPWSATRALYWVEVPLKAPGTGEYYQWTVKFPKPDMELAHEGTAHTFAFGTASPPEHVVTVEVIDKYTGTPIRNAQVTLHSSGTPYGDRTDDAGVARLNVPKGEYQLYVYMRFYEDFQTTAEVSSDLTVKAELLSDPDGGA
jgi:hypothetical protein